MIELRSEFKPFFYVASICLGAEIAFLIAFFLSPSEGWAILAALHVVAASIPLLAGAATAAIVGYMQPLRPLLTSGLLLFVFWLALLFLSVSLIATLVFCFAALVSYKMLQYHHVDRSKPPRGE